MAPDGATVTEGRDFPTIEAAWERADDMGSRWYFYPVSIVTTPKGFIRDIPRGMGRHWIGRRVSTLARAFASDEQAVCDWLNGEMPCPV